MGKYKLTEIASFLAMTGAAKRVIVIASKANQVAVIASKAKQVAVIASAAKQSHNDE